MRNEAYAELSWHCANWQKGRVKEMLCIVRQGFAEIPHSRKASLSHSHFRQLKFIIRNGKNRLHSAMHFQSEVV